MRGRKLQTLHAAAHRYIDNFPPNGRIGIVGEGYPPTRDGGRVADDLFSSTLTTVTDDGVRDELKAWVSSYLRPGVHCHCPPASNYRAGFQNAFSVFQASPAPARSSKRSMIFLTDGSSSWRNTDYAWVVQTAQALSVSTVNLMPINTVGFGQSVNVQIPRTIAEQTYGVYTAVPESMDPSELAELFHELTPTISAGRCEVNYTVMPTDPNGPVPLSIHIVDTAGSVGAEVNVTTDGTVAVVDTIAPIITAVTLSAVGGYASPFDGTLHVGVGDELILQFTLSEPVQSSGPVVNFGSCSRTELDAYQASSAPAAGSRCAQCLADLNVSSVEVCHSEVEVTCDESRMSCSATYVVPAQPHQSEGTVAFAIELYTDLAGNEGPLVTNASVERPIVIDLAAPELSAVCFSADDTTVGVNAEVQLEFTASKPLTGFELRLFSREWEYLQGSVLPSSVLPSSTGHAEGQMRMGGYERSVEVRIREGGARGVLQFRIDNGEWDAVCDDGFGTDEAHAICVILGYEGGSQYDTHHGDHNFAVDDLNCPRGATRVSECSAGQSPYRDNCGDSETVGLQCVVPTRLECTPSSPCLPLSGYSEGGQMRMGGSERSVEVRIREGGARGVLQFRIDNGEWDAVCDDGFGTDEAHAICVILGYEGGSQYDTHHGDHNFAVDDLNCPRGATRVSECSAGQSPYRDNCGDSETVGLQCTGDRTQEDPTTVAVCDATSLSCTVSTRVLSTDVAGPASFLLTYTDHYGVNGVAVGEVSSQCEPLTLDTEAPNMTMVSISSDAAPAPAGPGSQIALTFDVNEPVQLPTCTGTAYSQLDCASVFANSAPDVGAHSCPPGCTYSGLQVMLAGSPARTLECDLGAMRCTATQTVQSHEASVTTPVMMGGTCTETSDCDSHHFCRLVDTIPPTLTRVSITVGTGRRQMQVSDQAVGNESRCVPYSNVSETCGGFVPPHMVRRCAPGFDCQYDDAPGLMDAPGRCVHRDCSEDSDCGSDSYCRPVANETGRMACAAFVGAGEQCGGRASERSRCAAGLECVHRRVIGQEQHDEPGTCQKACSVPRDACGECAFFGTVEFLITFSDHAGNTASISRTTDGSAVNIDLTPPKLVSLSFDFEHVDDAVALDEFDGGPRQLAGPDNIVSISLGATEVIDAQSVTATILGEEADVTCADKGCTLHLTRPIASADPDGPLAFCINGLADLAGNVASPWCGAQPVCASDAVDLVVLIDASSAMSIYSRSSSARVATKRVLDVLKTGSRAAFVVMQAGRAYPSSGRLQDVSDDSIRAGMDRWIDANVNHNNNRGHSLNTRDAFEDAFTIFRGSSRSDNKPQILLVAAADLQPLPSFLGSGVVDSWEWTSSQTLLLMEPMTAAAGTNRDRAAQYQATCESVGAQTLDCPGYQGQFGSIAAGQGSCCISYHSTVLGRHGWGGQIAAFCQARNNPTNPRIYHYNRDLIAGAAVQYVCAVNGPWQPLSNGNQTWLQDSSARAAQTVSSRPLSIHSLLLGPVDQQLCSCQLAVFEQLDGSGWFAFYGLGTFDRDSFVAAGARDNQASGFELLASECPHSHACQVELFDGDLRTSIGQEQTQSGSSTVRTFTGHLRGWNNRLTSLIVRTIPGRMSDPAVVARIAANNRGTFTAVPDEETGETLSLSMINAVSPVTNPPVLDTTPPTLNQYSIVSRCTATAPCWREYPGHYLNGCASGLTGCGSFATLSAAQGACNTQNGCSGVTYQGGHGGSACCNNDGPHANTCGWCFELRQGTTPLVSAAGEYSWLAIATGTRTGGAIPGT
eukprot:COSAG02_NODE_1746_length_11096_cov_14.974084_2_plen_1785_part_01